MKIIIDISEQTYKDVCWYGLWLNPNEKTELVKAIRVAKPYIKTTTERTKGSWRDTGSGQECSVCKEIQYGYDSGRHFCANCGADMEDDK